MSTPTISIPEDRLRQLEELSRQFGIAPEELVRVSIEELIARPQADFREALALVLKKNAGLYQRLA